jgi:hypothetical protein
MGGRQLAPPKYRMLLIVIFAFPRIEGLIPTGYTPPKRMIYVMHLFPNRKAFKIVGPLQAASQWQGKNFTEVGAGTARASRVSIGDVDHHLFLLAWLAYG